jgi:hypothetical protein
MILDRAFLSPSPRRNIHSVRHVPPNWPTKPGARTAAPRAHPTVRRALDDQGSAHRTVLPVRIFMHTRWNSERPVMPLRALVQWSRGEGREPLTRWRDPAQTTRRTVAAGPCHKMVRAPSPRARPSMVIVSCAYCQQDMPAGVASVLIDRLPWGPGCPGGADHGDAAAVR